MIFKTILECMVFDDRATIYFLQLGLLEKLRTIILSYLVTTTSLQATQTPSNQKQNIDIQIICSILCRLFISFTNEESGSVLLAQYNLIHVILRLTKFTFTFFHHLHSEIRQLSLTSLFSRYYVSQLNENIALSLLNLLNVFLQQSATFHVESKVSY
jgi:hypothetical protein